LTSDGRQIRSDRGAAQPDRDAAVKSIDAYNSPDCTPSMPVGPGTRLDAYELLQPLGAGGMGEVWLARDLRLNRKIAIKLLPADLTRDPTRVTRFQQEARAASALSHPNVCHIYGLGETPDGQHFIAMEYVDGETLRSRLGRERLSLAEALDVATQAASALTAAHTAGVVHRDFKPENVMLRQDGFVKVLDFVLAKLFPSGQGSDTAGSTHTLLRTDAGTVVGTVSYMSPEQARGQEVDGRTDIWAFGVSLYEMVAGRSPFPGASSTDVLAAILDRDPAPLARFDPDVPHELQRIVTKALRKERTQRYQTMQDLLLDLQALRQERISTELRSSGMPQDARAVTADRQGPPAQSSAEYLIAQAGRHKLVIATIALSSLAALAGLVWWIERPHREPVKLSVREPILTRLIANPPDLPIQSALISPDGRYVAYADPTGIQIRLIDTGETHGLPDTKGMAVYAWSGDSTKVRASRCEAGTCLGWSISLVGNSRYRTDGSWPEGETVFPMPGGSRLLRATTSHELTLDMLDGSAPRVIAQHFGSVMRRSAGGRTSHVTPTADGTRVLFSTSDSATIQSVSVEGGTPVTLWKAQQGWYISDLIDLPDHRMIVAIDRVAPERGMALHELRTDSSGAVVGEPRRLTEWRPEFMGYANASADGKRVMFLSNTAQSDAYVADFHVQSSTLGTPRRLTLDERRDYPTAWTPDSKSILFTSTRNGTADIFRQDINSDSAEPLLVGPGDQIFPRITGDGQWVLYLDAVSPPGPTRLMRAPLSGGVSQPLFDVRRFAGCQCSPRGRCVVLETDGDEIIVSAVDAVRGKGAELARVPASTTAAAISPDGDGLAFIVPGEDGRRNRIRLISFAGKPARDVIVPRANWLASLDGLSNGLGFFSLDNTADRRNLLFIRPDGTSEVLWSSPGLVGGWAIPAPDGKHVAINAEMAQSNIWMMTDF
jgi:eukaryotic-like serine/threonine-protein kinase